MICSAQPHSGHPVSPFGRFETNSYQMKLNRLSAVWSKLPHFSLTQSDAGPKATESDEPGRDESVTAHCGLDSQGAQQRLIVPASANPLAATFAATAGTSPPVSHTHMSLHDPNNRPHPPVLTPPSGVYSPIRNIFLARADDVSRLTGVGLSSASGSTTRLSCRDRCRRPSASAW